jgi:hypothetical protein
VSAQGVSARVIITAPTAGTGKSLLVDVVSILATGAPMPVVSPGWGEEELEKRLSRALLGGRIRNSNSEGDYRSSIPRDTNGECTPLTGDRANHRDRIAIRTGGHSSQLVDPLWVTELPFGPVVVPV